MKKAYENYKVIRSELKNFGEGLVEKKRLWCLVKLI